jgi:hypothetical protein
MVKWHLYLMAFLLMGLFWPLHHFFGIERDLYVLAEITAATVYLGAIRRLGW